MVRGLTDSVDPSESAKPDMKQIADMLYAIFCAIQEINAKLPELPKPEERPVNGL